MACLSREFCLVLLSLEIMLCTMRGRPADRRVMEAPDPAVRTLSRTSLSREPESSRTPLSSSSRREHEVRESGYYNRVRSSGVFIGVCEAVHSFFGCIRYWLPICSNEVSATGPPPTRGSYVSVLRTTEGYIWVRERHLEKCFKIPFGCAENLILISF